MARVLIVDDDLAFREQLRALLQERFPALEIVASVADGHAAVASALAHSPDVVLMDFAMPGPDGVHAAGVIRQALPQARVVILSGAEPPAQGALPAGVDYVRKGAPMLASLEQLFS